MISFVATAVIATLIGQNAAPPLTQELLHEDPVALARAVRLQGDARRGAIVFHQSYTQCATCHAPSDPKNRLGPDLAQLGKDVTDEYLIESILFPSKQIKKGFEQVVVATTQGKTIGGLLVSENADGLVIREATAEGKLISISRAEIEAKRISDRSIMPDGLANTLQTRQEFLDLARYLREIADHGVLRAQELRPDPALLVPRIADYESKLDHAGLISSMNQDSYANGEAIYSRVCANCHGMGSQEGSMPTSLKFASGQFKNGNDPYSLYKTLTHGFGQMPPQPWIVPRQKYEVIHYIREAFLKRSNLSQYITITPAYLASLPKGNTRGPAPQHLEPWSQMDYGPSLMATLEVGRDGTNFAYKGIAVRLDTGPGGVAKGHFWTVYDHDTMRLAAAWSGNGFSDWDSINFNGRHVVHPSIAGKRHVLNSPSPGWANPANGSFSDPRIRGRDDRPYGPLPSSWLRYRGIYHHGERVIIAYNVGTTEILESPGIEPGATDNDVFYTRTIEMGPAEKELVMQAAPASVAVCVAGDSKVETFERDGQRFVRFPASSMRRLVKIFLYDGPQARLQEKLREPEAPVVLSLLTNGGPSRWPERLKTYGIIGRSDSAFAVDTLTLPEKTPWNSQLRVTGFDFIDARTAALCDWDGDVWRVEGFDDPGAGLTWRRIASGLFQPLGLKIIGGQIYVCCRDQIAILRDLNNDGETDYVECFNSDHQVTEHFHEFAMDLQTDDAGNLYYTKAARHGKTALVPQHGTLLRVDKTGKKTDILAVGFRAPNGVCVNPDGTFFVTDQEGFWLPKNRINWVQPGSFHGNMWGYHNITDTSDTVMEPPLCWITNAIDRSPAEVVRVNSKSWGALNGGLLNLSYGYGKIFAIPHERVGDLMQGGVSPLPIPQFPTGVMRGRFNPGDGHLYTCGMFAWAGTQQTPGGFYRVRATSKPAHLPIGFHATKTGVSLTFSDPLDRKTATDPSRYNVKVWSLKRSENYGSPHVGEHGLKVERVTLSEDGKTVLLAIPTITPVQCFEIGYAIQGSKGERVESYLDGTIHKLAD